MLCNQPPVNKNKFYMANIVGKSWNKEKIVLKLQPNPLTNWNESAKDKKVFIKHSLDIILHNHCGLFLFYECGDISKE